MPGWQALLNARNTEAAKEEASEVRRALDEMALDSEQGRVKLNGLIAAKDRELADLTIQMEGMLHTQRRLEAEVAMAKRANMGGADRVVEELHKQRSEGMQRDLLLLQHEILAKDTEINRWRDVALAGSGMSAGMAGSGMSAGMADYNPEAQVLRQRTDSLQRDLTLCQQEMRNKDTEIARWREAASGGAHDTQRCQHGFA